MIYVLEAFVEDYLHVLANVNLIKIFNRVYDDQPISFTAPLKHKAHVESYFSTGKSNISFDHVANLDVPTTNIFNRFFLIISRIRRDYRMLKSTFKKCKPGDIVVLTHIYFPSLILLKLLKKRYPAVITFSIIHGDVEFVFHAKTKSQKIMGFCHDLMFKIKARNFYYLFLTPASKKILVERKKLKENELFAIELPTFPNGNPPVATLEFPFDLVKIGHVGSAGTRKNVQLFYELASLLEDEIKNGKLEFTNVGVLEASILPYLNPLIKDFVNQTIEQALTREKYDKEISGLHYAIFFYGENDFILRSSAAFFDAIFYEKPMIVLRNRFFEDVFAREGEMGFLCDDIEEMALVISDLLKPHSARSLQYQKFVDNVKRYKQSLNIDSIADTLRDDLKIIAYQN